MQAKGVVIAMCVWHTRLCVYVGSKVYVVFRNGFLHHFYYNLFFDVIGRYHGGYSLSSVSNLGYSRRDLFLKLLLINVVFLLLFVSFVDRER